MGTRRWVAALESWMRRSNLTAEDLAERSKHSGPHVLALFKDPDPNPTLALFLDLVNAAGARFHGVEVNKPVEVILRLKEIMARENIKTVSALSRVAGVNRSQLSTLWNDAAPNPALATFDRLVVALGAEQDFVLVDLRDAEVAAAVAVGQAEVRTIMKQEAKLRHLRALPSPTPQSSAEPTADRIEPTAAVSAKIAELSAQLAELHRTNVALEKVRDDQAAEIARLWRSNRTLERLRAEDAAELARLRQEQRELQERHALAVEENARVTQQNRDFAIRHARDAAELERLTSQKKWDVFENVMIGVASATATAAVGAYFINKKRAP